MKKLFLSLTVIIFLLIGSIFGILFTKYGNGLISSYIENRVNDGQEDVKLKVNNFRLTFKTINFDAKINDDSIINISGDLEIFKQSVDLKYDIRINDLSTLKNLTKQDFKGPFSTTGTFKGNKRESIIQGVSDIALSQTKYYINLVNFEAKNIHIELKDAKIEELLTLLNKPTYAKGDLNIKADIKNIDVDNLDGLITANISKGKINNEVVNKEFKQTIQSSINFQSDITASLLGKKVEVKSELITSLADIFMDKTIIDLEKDKIISDYKIDVKNLNKLEGVVGKKLNGDFLTAGNIFIENSIISISGNSNIFESSTTYNLKVKDSALQNINFKIENAKVEKLLHILDKPVYATGNLNIEGDIKNANLNKLDGVITSKITEAKIVNEVVNSVFQKDIKDTIKFDLQVDTSLVPNQAISRAAMNTNIVNINVDKAIFDFKEASFTSDYLLKIPSLIMLKDFTKTKLRGSMDIKGKIEDKDDFLFVDGSSNILGGVFNFNLKNDDLNATANNIQIKELTHMLYKPEIFDSKANFEADYNLLIKKGTLTGKLINGHFLPNDFSNLITQLAKFDLTREIYETVDVNSTINQSVLTSTMNMKSKNTEIDINNSILDLENNTIDAKLDTRIKNTSFAINVNGDTTNPKISIDTKDLLKEQLNKQLDKNRDKIEEKLNKVLDGKIEDEKAKELIKNLKSIF
jgi:ribosome-associated translation inhibitor RaiA